MSETTPTVPSPEPEPQARGFLANLFDLYFAPKDAFTSILKKPRFLVPMVLVIALAVTFSVVWVKHMDAREFGKLQMQEAGQWEKLSPEQRDQALSFQAKIMPIVVPVMSLVGPVVMILVTAAVLLLIFREAMASTVGFKESVSITSFSFLAVSLISTPLLLLTMFLKEEWNVDPNQLMATNLAALLDKAETAKPLYALAGSMDLFSFFTIFLLSVGFGVASKRSTGTAMWGVLVPWAVIVALKVGWAAIF
jgi:hypothetical protein